MSALIWLVGVLGGTSSLSAAHLSLAASVKRLTFSLPPLLSCPPGDAVYNDRVLPLILAFKALTAVVDFSLTATIIYYLLRSKSGWKKTDKAVEVRRFPLLLPQALPFAHSPS